MAKQAVKPAPKERLWPASKIEMWPLDKLKAYPKNPRTHSPEQISQLVASFKEFGWTIPMLVDEAGEIIAGHGREAMAAKVGLKQVPVIVARGWTDAQKIAYRIADNQLALSSSWDRELLAGELQELKMDGFDFTLTGFGEDDLVAFLAGAVPPDGFPEVDEDIATEHSCPKCGYRWSGKTDAAPPTK